MKLNDFWKIPDGISLQLMQVSKRTFLVIKREGREFCPVYKGSFTKCQRFIREFNSFFDADDNPEVTDYFFSYRK